DHGLVLVGVLEAGAHALEAGAVVDVVVDVRVVAVGAAAHVLFLSEPRRQSHCTNSSGWSNSFFHPVPPQAVQAGSASFLFLSERRRATASRSLRSDWSSQTSSVPM